MSKPTFVIVPGAWHSPESFGPTSALLQKAGYKTRGVTLACWGAEPPVQDLAPDAAAVEAAIQAELDAGHDVVVVMHSYGGVAGQEGLKNIDPARVRQLVYVTAFAFPEGASVYKAMGQQDPPWLVVDGDYVWSSNQHEIFYNDLSKEAADAQVAALKHHSYRCFHADQSHAPWKAIPSTYVLCEKDNAIPLDAQKGMIAGAQALAPNAFATVETMDTSHSPFLSQPEELARLLVKAAGGA